MISQLGETLCSEVFHKHVHIRVSLGSEMKNSQVFGGARKVYSFYLTEHVRSMLRERKWDEMHQLFWFIRPLPPKPHPSPTLCEMTPFSTPPELLLSQITVLDGNGEGKCLNQPNSFSF